MTYLTQYLTTDFDADSMTGEEKSFPAFLYDCQIIDGRYAMKGDLADIMLNIMKEEDVDSVTLVNYNGKMHLEW